MGNYLLSLRVPPPSEDERNHPLYYDWTVPGLTPYKSEKSDSASKGAPVCPVDSPKRSDHDADRIKEAGQKSVAASPTGKVSLSHNAAQEELKNTLTSTVDTNDVRPADVGTHRASQIPKSTSLHSRKAAGSISKTTAKGGSKSNIKAVDSTRPQTVDTRKYGDVEHQVAAKSATNIHKTSINKSIKSSKTSKSLKGTS